MHKETLVISSSPLLFAFGHDDDVPPHVSCHLLLPPCLHGFALIEVCTSFGPFVARSTIETIVLEQLLARLDVTKGHRQEGCLVSVEPRVGKWAAVDKASEVSRQH